MTTLAFYQKLAGHKRLTTRMAAQLAGMSIPATSMALRRLAAADLGAPMKKGVWLIGPPTSKPGTLVTAAADPYPAYLSGWSALRLHNRIEQIPQTQFAVTLGRPRRMSMGATRITLHHMEPELFCGYEYDAAVDGFVATPEKALFDLAYFSVMQRSPVSGALPETDLKDMRWKTVTQWTRRIPAQRTRKLVAAALTKIRTTHLTPTASTPLSPRIAWAKSTASARASRPRKATCPNPPRQATHKAPTPRGAPACATTRYCRREHSRRFEISRPRA